MGEQFGDANVEMTGKERGIEKVRDRSRSKSVWKPGQQRESSSLKCPWEVKQDTGKRDC